MIARTNAFLITRAIKILTENRNVKISINGDVKSFARTAKEVIDVWKLSKNKKPELPAFKKYKNYEDFKESVSDLELNEFYGNV